MVPFSLDAYTALATMIGEIRATDTGLAHPILGQIELSVRTMNPPDHVSLALTYGAVSWDAAAGVMRRGTDELLRLTCPSAAWQAVGASSLHDRLDFVVQAFRSQSSLSGMTGMHGVMQLGVLRLWTLLEDPLDGAHIKDATIDGKGLLSYLGLGYTHHIMDISTGRMLTHAERLAAPYIPGFLWIYDTPLGAASFHQSSTTIMSEDENNEDRRIFENGMEPVTLSAHAKIELLQEILAKYRTAGLPEPDLSGL